MKRREKTLTLVSLCWRGASMVAVQAVAAGLFHHGAQGIARVRTMSSIPGAYSCIDHISLSQVISRGFCAKPLGAWVF